MFLLFRTCLDIALLRKGPDALPRSGLVLLLTLVGFSIPFTLYYSLPGASAQPDPALHIALIFFGALAYVLILRFRGFPERTMQTLSAVFGVAALLNGIDVLLLAPVLLIGGELVVLNLVRLCLLAWSFMVETFIVSKAFEWPRFFAATFVLCIFFAQYYVLYSSPGGH